MMFSIRRIKSGVKNECVIRKVKRIWHQPHLPVPFYIYKHHLCSIKIVCFQMCEDQAKPKGLHIEWMNECIDTHISTNALESINSTQSPPSA